MKNLKNFRWKYAGVILAISSIVVIYQNCSKNTTSVNNEQLPQSKFGFILKSQFCGRPDAAVADSKGNIYVVGYGDQQARANPFQSCDNRILRKSNDGGNTWVEIEYPLDSVNSNLTTDDNGNLYARSDSKSIYQSTDGGLTWNSFATVTYNGTQLYVNKFVFAPNGDLYAYGPYQYFAGNSTFMIGGIFKRASGSDSWTLVDSMHGSLFSIVVDTYGSVYWAGCDNYAGGQCLVRKSNDNGNNWSDVWKGNFEPSGGIVFDKKGNTLIGLNYLANSSLKVSGVLVLPSNKSVFINSDAKIKFLKIGQDNALNIISATSSDWVFHRTTDYLSLTEVGKFIGQPNAAELDSSGNFFVFDQVDVYQKTEWVTRVLGK